MGSPGGAPGKGIRLHDVSECARNACVPLDAVSRLYDRREALDADLAPFWAHVGFDLSPIARVNASLRARAYQSYYSDADAETVSRRAREDIERFGYRFDAVLPGA